MFGVAEEESEVKEAARDSGRLNHATCTVLETCAGGDECSLQVCSAFREPELEALEYDADLRSWWEKGYGYKLTALLSQMLLTEVGASACLMHCT